jgi:hypothetical protein
MQVTFEATTAELEQLAKMAYIAQYVFDSSGKFSTGFKYPDMPVFDSALRILTKTLLQAMPGTELLEVDERSDNIFTHTIQMEEECGKILQEFGETVHFQKVCTELTRRDYIEKGGNPEDAVIGHNTIYTILYNSNMAELKQYGLSRFKIEE